MTERRRHPRVRINSEFAAAADGHLAFIENVSLCGAFVRTRLRFAEGSHVDLRASLVLDDVYLLHVQARVVQMRRNGVAVEFGEVTPEMRSRIERALAFVQVRQELATGTPQALAAWQAMQAPIKAAPLFDDKVLAQPNLLARAAQADRRQLRQFLQTHRAQVSSSKIAPLLGKPNQAATSSLSTKSQSTSPTRPPSSLQEHLDDPLDNLAAKASITSSPGPTKAAPPASAATSSTSSLAAASSPSTSGTRRTPGRAVASSHPRAKTAKTANPNHPRTTTLSIPLTASEVDAWEAGLVPVVNDEPPTRLQRQATGSVPAVLQEPRKDRPSEEEVTRVFAVNASSSSNERQARESAKPNPHDTPLPAHLRLPSPDEDFI